MLSIGGREVNQPRQQQQLLLLLLRQQCCNFTYYAHDNCPRAWEQTERWPVEGSKYLTCWQCQSWLTPAGHDWSCCDVPASPVQWHELTTDSLMLPAQTNPVTQHRGVRQSTKAAGQWTAPKAMASNPQNADIITKLLE